MAEYSFEIDTELPTLNKYINIERTNKYLAAKEKERFTNICMLFIMEQLKGFRLDKLYDVHIIWNVPNEREDADNIYFGVKFILDGLCEAEKTYKFLPNKKKPVIDKHGILYSDGRKNIRHIYNEIYTGDKYLVTVTLKEVNIDTHKLYF